MELITEVLKGTEGWRPAQLIRSEEDGIET